MDQIATACCTAGHVLHLDTRDLTFRQIPFDMTAEGLRLLVVDTRVKHQLGDGAYAERRAACEAGAAALGVPALRDVPYPGLTTALARLGDETLRRRVRHVVTENQRVQRVITELESGGARRIGPLLTAGHASLRDDYQVTVPELDLAAGCQVLRGDDALAYVRARKGIGDGSDTGRIARQQEFLALLVRKMHSGGVLLNPTRLYPVLSTATSALTVDAGLSSLTRLYDLIREIREVPAEAIGFVTVPRESSPSDGDRDVLVQPAAGELFRQLREDRPVDVPGWTDGTGHTGSR
jgi:hypothetical protein